MGNLKRPKRDMEMEAMKVKKLYFELQLKYYKGLANYRYWIEHHKTHPEDTEDEYFLDDPEEILELVDILLQESDESQESQVQPVLEYYILSFRAFEVGEYFIAAVSLVEYFDKLVWLMKTTKDKDGKLFFKRDEDCMYAWVGDCCELTDLINNLERSDNTLISLKLKDVMESTMIFSEERTIGTSEMFLN